MKKLLSALGLSIILCACATKESTSGDQAGVQDFPNTLKLATNAALFDLPSSIASDSSTLASDQATPALARMVATTLAEDRTQAYAAYMAVPVYILIAEQAKQNVQSMIEKLSQQKIPAPWSGKMDSLDVSTDAFDTILDGVPVHFLKLQGSKDGILRIKIRLFSSDSGTYRGSIFMSEPGNHASKARVDFNSIADNGNQSMVVSFQRDSIGLAKSGDPTRVRIKAVKRASGRIVLTGASYHPMFEDYFWGNGPKIYAFKAITDPVKNHAVLRVAFGNAANADSNFLAEHAVEKGILSLVTERLRTNLRDSAGWLTLVNFCLDSNLAARDALSAKYWVSIKAYQSTRTADDFTSADLERYLELNRDAIFENDPSVAGLRGLYLLLAVKPPVYLSARATIVGAGLDAAPDGFGISAATLDEDTLSLESPQQLSSQLELLE